VFAGEPGPGRLKLLAEDRTPVLEPSQMLLAPGPPSFKTWFNFPGRCRCCKLNTPKGDTATISEEGKALAKGSSDKGTDCASTAIKTSIGQAAAVSKATLPKPFKSQMQRNSR